jgi:predicted dehydrogenase
MQSVRVGVIGVGHLGYHHARNYAALDHATLVGVVDHDPERAARAAADFDAARFDSVDALLRAGVDAASVAVPTTDHHEVTLQLLEGGADVLVEKPIAATVEEAEGMVHCAESSGRLLQVGHIERFNGAVIALFDSVKNPKFIECHRLSPYPNRGADVSVVLDLMIHDLDIVRALVGSEARSIDAVGVPVFSEQEDIANARIRFDSGCVANVTCSRVSMEKMRKIRIFAEDAYVSTDYSAQEVLVYRKKPGRLEPGADPMAMISIDPLDVKHDEPLKLELASFVECVRERKRPVVTGADALAALTLAQQVIDSISEHGAPSDSVS